MCVMADGHAKVSSAKTGIDNRELVKTGTVSEL